MAGMTWLLFQRDRGNVGKRSQCGAPFPRPPAHSDPSRSSESALDPGQRLLGTEASFAPIMPAASVSLRNRGEG
jgi:hypothetical protein